jgi:hypothetical protein
MNLKTHLRTANFIANLMDQQFRIFNYRFGLDPILGLIPGIGDLVAVFVSTYIVWIGIQMKLPRRKIYRMIGNVLLDFIIGAIPLVGDVGDFVIKANTKNIKILKEREEFFYR